MAFFDDDLFGGMFDINGDGKTDIGEEFLAFKMFEEATGEDDGDLLADGLPDGEDDLFGGEDDF